MSLARKKEPDTLQELEAKVARSFVDGAAALRQIRDEARYRTEAGYDTFEEYCRERWGFSGAHARRLVAGAELAERVAPIGAISESQARVILRIKDRQKQVEAFREAVESAPQGKLTARHIAEVVAKRLQSKPRNPSKPKPSNEVTAEDVQRAREALKDKPLPKPAPIESGTVHPAYGPPDASKWWPCPDCGRTLSADGAAAQGWDRRGYCGDCEGREVSLACQRCGHEIANDEAECKNCGAHDDTADAEEEWHLPLARQALEQDLERHWNSWRGDPAIFGVVLKGWMQEVEEAINGRKAG